MLTQGRHVLLMLPGASLPAILLLFLASRWLLQFDPDQHYADVDDPHQGGGDAVRDLPPGGPLGDVEGLGPVEPEAAVDDAQGQQDAAEPQVHVHEVHDARDAVVEEVQLHQRLHGQEAEDDDANHTVVVIELLDI